MIAIEKCLELRYPELKQKQRFLTTSSKSVFFEGRGPLDVILSGNLEQVESAMLYSIVETAIANGLILYDYMVKCMKEPAKIEPDLDTRAYK